MVFGFLPTQEQAQYNWFHWFVAASVCGVVLMGIFFLVSYLLFRNQGRPYIPPETVLKQVKLLGLRQS